MGLIVAFLISFGSALAFAYILYWLDRYEKEPLLLLGGVFLWGAIVAAGGAFLINTILGLGVYIFTNSEVATDMTTGSVIAPLVEETLKGLSILVVFLVFRTEFDSVLDGIIYAGVAALGFAATENTYYIYSYGFQEAGWVGLFSLAFIRIVLVGWQHPFYTAFTGIGLALARLNRTWTVRVIAPLLGFSVAVFTHGFHNFLSSILRGAQGLVVSAIFDWGGWMIMFGVILWAGWREQGVLKKFLPEEVQAGIISQKQCHTASSAWLQSFASLSAVFKGGYLKTRRFYQLCGEYAHKRQQYTLLGDEGGNLAILQQLRTEIARLAPDARA